MTNINLEWEESDKIALEKKLQVHKEKIAHSKKRITELIHKYNSTHENKYPED